MKQLHIAVALIASLSSPIFAQGNSADAPGKQKMPGASSKQYAPGQQKDSGKSAKEYSPGHNKDSMMKEHDKKMRDDKGPKGQGMAPKN